MEGSKVIECNATECAYNKNMECHTIAITVGSVEPSCDTFVANNKHGGIKDITGGVGACRKDDCMFNESLECSAQGIKVHAHGHHADCTTYQRR